MTLYEYLPMRALLNILLCLKIILYCDRRMPAELHHRRRVAKATWSALKGRASGNGTWTRREAVCRCVADL